MYCTSPQELSSPIHPNNNKTDTHSNVTNYQTINQRGFSGKWSDTKRNKFQQDDRDRYQMVCGYYNLFGVDMPTEAACNLQHLMMYVAILVS